MLDHALDHARRARFRAVAALLLLAAGRVRAQGDVQLGRIVRLGSDVVFLGAQEAPGAANQGRVSNIALLFGPKGVLCFGTGASHAHGQALLRWIEREARAPVRLAINAQATPDHVLGNTAFAQRNIEVLAHAETDRFMVQNCDSCIRDVRNQAGPEALGDSRLARARVLVEGDSELDLIGRPLALRWFGPTFQAGSLALLDREARTLHAGELVSIGRIPDVHNADIRNWIRVLGELPKLPIDHLVPAHGPIVPPRRAAELAGYLAALWQAVQQVYAAGVAIQDAVREVQLPHYRAWALYDAQHGRNVHHAYLKLEAEELAR